MFIEALQRRGVRVSTSALGENSSDRLPDPAEDPADFVPDAAVAPVSRLGNLWQLGRHRLLCGNALDPEAFATLMGEERAAAVFTDPPYNVPIDGHASGLGAIHHRPFPWPRVRWTPPNSLIS